MVSSRGFFGTRFNGVFTVVRLAGPFIHIRIHRFFEPQIRILRCCFARRAIRIHSPPGTPTNSTADLPYLRVPVS